MLPRSPYKGTSGLQRILNATGYSLAGFKAAFQNEAAFRQIILINLLLIPLSFFMPVSRVEQVLMIVVCLLAIIVELINSAIEAVVDPENIASCAVLEKCGFVKEAYFKENEFYNGKFLDTVVYSKLNKGS